MFRFVAKPDPADLELAFRVLRLAPSWFEHEPEKAAKKIILGEVLTSEDVRWIWLCANDRASKTSDLNENRLCAALMAKIIAHPNDIKKMEAQYRGLRLTTNPA